MAATPTIDALVTRSSVQLPSSPPSIECKLRNFNFGYILSIRRPFVGGKNRKKYELAVIGNNKSRTCCVALPLSSTFVCRCIVRGATGSWCTRRPRLRRRRVTRRPQSSWQRSTLTRRSATVDSHHTTGPPNLTPAHAYSHLYDRHMPPPHAHMPPGARAHACVDTCYTHAPWLPSMPMPPPCCRCFARALPLPTTRAHPRLVTSDCTAGATVLT